MAGIAGGGPTTVNVAGVALLAAATTLVATPVAMVVARRTGIVDRPGPLKPQTSPVPYLGGAAVMAGIAVGTFGQRVSVLVPLLLALVLGIADDKKGIPPIFRLVAEFVIGGVVLAVCPLHVPGAVAVLIIPVTVLLINGVNLLDGMDMLAAGVVGVAAVGFAVLLLGPDRHLAVALAASLAGFLVFNRPPARIYLGDGGAYLLGTALAVLVAGAWAPKVSTTSGVAAAGLIVVPVAEVAFAMIRRIRGRRSLVDGDRRHPYDLLAARGWSTWATTGTYVGLQLAITLAVVVTGRRSSLQTAVIVDGLAALLLVLLAGASGALSPEQEAVP